MHEFILTLEDATFDKIQGAGTPKAQAIARIGKLFLDFAFMLQRLLSQKYTDLWLNQPSHFQSELDQFAEVIIGIYKLINEKPEVLQSVHFTPIDRVDEVGANKKPELNEPLDKLSEIIDDRINANELKALDHDKLFERIEKAHQKFVEKQQNNSYFRH